jgi:STAS-like domain of unknown function (DUF4325)
MLYKVRDTTGEYAIDGSDGLKLYNEIHSDLLEGNSVELDFDGVHVFASIFFNFAIGQLLRDLPADTLNILLSFKNLSSTGKEILDEVIKNAKLYYSDFSYRNAVDAVMEEYAASC